MDIKFKQIKSKISYRKIKFLLYEPNGTLWSYAEKYSSSMTFFDDYYILDISVDANILNIMLTREPNHR